MAIELKTDPKYGYFPWWPEDGDDWVHPEDVDVARSHIPSTRVWRRDGREDDFVVLTYGQLAMRVRRTLWREVKWEGFGIGDLVEVRTWGMQNEHRTGTIRDMLWDEHAGQINYQLQVLDEEVENPVNYTAADLKHVAATDARAEVRIDPPEDSGEAYEISPES